MSVFYDGNGNSITIGGGSGTSAFGVTDYKLYTDNDGSARQAVLRQEQEKKKPEEVTQEEKEDLKKCGEDIQAENKKKNDILKEYADGNERVHQLIDLALLQNGMLRGEALTKFVKRSVSMIK